MERDDYNETSIKNRPQLNDQLPSPKRTTVGQPVHSINDIKQHGFATNSHSPEFYWCEHHFPGTGSRNLTAKAFSLLVDEVTTEEARFSLTISSLLLQLTKEQQALLGECMLQAANSKDSGLSIFKKTRVPTSVEDFKQFYLAGKNALIPNLPHPIPCKTGDGTHSYVTLSDLLANELAKDTKFDDFQFETNIEFKADYIPGISETPAAYKLFVKLKKDEHDGEFVLYLWSKEWRDDFDPNNTKASRNQVWSNTTTICPPKDETKGRNTYFLSLSCKGDDHSVVEDIFQKELEILSTTGGVFYHGGFKRLIRVKLGKLLVCVDHPERTSLLQVGDHNGTYSSFWAHSCFVDGFCKENHLPSCEQCRKNRVELTEFRQPLQVQSHLEMPRILAQLGHTQRT